MLTVMVLPAIHPPSNCTSFGITPRRWPPLLSGSNPGARSGRNYALSAAHQRLKFCKLHVTGTSCGDRGSDPAQPALSVRPLGDSLRVSLPHFGEHRISEDGLVVIADDGFVYAVSV